MGYVIRMPQLGMSMTEGILVEWCINQGESVELGDVIAIVETDKVSNEVEAREGGVLRRLLAEESDVMEPGAPMGILAAPDEDLQPLLDSAAESDGVDVATEIDQEQTTESQPSVDRERQTTDAGMATTDVKATPGARKLADEYGINLEVLDGTGPGGAIVEEDIETAHETVAAESPSEPEPVTERVNIKASPGARRLAEKRNVDLTNVAGTGPEGTITEDDVEAVQQVPASDQPGPRMTVTERKPLSDVQQQVSNRLQTSFQEAPHVTLHRTYRTDALNDALAAAEWFGIEVSMNDILLKAVAEALTEHPEVNAHFEDGEHILVQERNVAFAVDTDDGLVTPVVPAVDETPIQSVNEIRRDLTERALDGRLSIDELQGGSLTVSNLGMFGVDQFSPIINPPQIAILGVGRERDDSTMTLSLSFDHRVVNGADAAKFLSTITNVLTTQSRLAKFFDVARS